MGNGMRALFRSSLACLGLALPALGCTNGLVQLKLLSETLPDAGAKVSLLGVDVAAIRLVAAEPSAPIKLALALARARKT